MVERGPVPLNGVADEDDEEFEIVTVVDDDGTEIDYALIQEMLIGSQNYALLAPLDELEAEEPTGEVLVLRVEGDDLVSIEDPDELERVASHLSALNRLIENA